MDDAVDCLMSFSDFLFAFQIQFYYSGESPRPGPPVGASSPSGPRASAPPPSWRPSPRAAQRTPRCRRRSHDSASSRLRKPRRSPRRGARQRKRRPRSRRHQHTFGAGPEASPLSENVRCAGPSARHRHPPRGAERQAVFLREKRAEGSCDAPAAGRWSPADGGPAAAPRAQPLAESAGPESAAPPQRRPAPGRRPRPRVPSKQRLRPAIPGAIKMAERMPAHRLTHGDVAWSAGPEAADCVHKQTFRTGSSSKQRAGRPWSRPWPSRQRVAPASLRRHVLSPDGGPRARAAGAAV